MDKKVTCCDKPYFSKSLCKSHYQKQYYRKHNPPKFISEAARFWHYVQKTEDCWLWQGGKTYKGYGQFKVGLNHIAAHRYSYILKHRAIPEGKQLDHLCRIRHCVNPDHLEPVTNRENVLRGSIVKNKKSGLPLGVFKNKKRFSAAKSINGKIYYLGTYDTPEEAAAVYLQTKTCLS